MCVAHMQWTCKRTKQSILHNSAFTQVCELTEEIIVTFRYFAGKHVLRLKHLTCNKILLRSNMSVSQSLRKFDTLIPNSYRNYLHFTFTTLRLLLPTLLLQTETDD